MSLKVPKIDRPKIEDDSFNSKNYYAPSESIPETHASKNPSQASQQINAM